MFVDAIALRSHSIITRSIVLTFFPHPNLFSIVPTAAVLVHSKLV